MEFFEGVGGPGAGSAPSAASRTARSLDDAPSIDAEIYVPAADDSEASPSDVEAAKRLLAESSPRLYAHNFQKGLVEMALAYRLSRSPGYLLSMANLARAQGLNARAAALYAAYVDRAPPPSRDAEVAERLRAAAHQETATLLFDLDAGVALDMANVETETRDHVRLRGPRRGRFSIDVGLVELNVEQGDGCTARRFLVVAAEPGSTHALIARGHAKR